MILEDICEMMRISSIAQLVISLPVESLIYMNWCSVYIWTRCLIDTKPTLDMNVKDRWSIEKNNNILNSYITLKLHLELWNRLQTIGKPNATYWTLEIWKVVNKWIFGMLEIATNGNYAISKYTNKYTNFISNKALLF